MERYKRDLWKLFRKNGKMKYRQKEREKQDMDKLKNEIDRAI